MCAAQVATGSALMHMRSENTRKFNAGTRKARKHHEKQRNLLGLRVFSRWKAISASSASPGAGSSVRFATYLMIDPSGPADPSPALCVPIA